MNPQPFRNGEDELPMRDFRKDLLADMHGKLKDAFLVAGRTEASDFAGEGDEQVVPAIVTADSGKALTQVSALDELIGRNPHGWPVKTVFCAVPLGVDSLKLVIMGGDNFPEGRRGRVTSAVELGLERMVFQRHRHIH